MRGLILLSESKMKTFSPWNLKDNSDLIDGDSLLKMFEARSKELHLKKRRRNISNFSVVLVVFAILAGLISSLGF